jgi:ferrous iron transport protein A
LLDVRLHEATAGDVVIVREVADDAIGRRLEALGFIPGSRVEVGRRAPLGDPTVYRVRGADIAVRRDTARAITVEREPA